MVVHSVSPVKEAAGSMSSGLAVAWEKYAFRRALNTSRNRPAQEETAPPGLARPQVTKHKRWKTRLVNTEAAWQVKQGV